MALISSIHASRLGFLEEVNRVQWPLLESNQFSRFGEARFWAEPLFNKYKIFLFWTLKHLKYKVKICQYIYKLTDIYEHMQFSHFSILNIESGWQFLEKFVFENLKRNYNRSNFENRINFNITNAKLVIS